MRFEWEHGGGAAACLHLVDDDMWQPQRQRRVPSMIPDASGAEAASKKVYISPLSKAMFSNKKAYDLQERQAPERVPGTHAGGSGDGRALEAESIQDDGSFSAWCECVVYFE